MELRRIARNGVPHALALPFVILLVGVACAGHGGEREEATSRPGTPPVRIASLYECLPPFDLAAYSRDGRVYPAGHPQKPGKRVKPERCFSSRREAKAAGFDLAAPPLEGGGIGGLYVVPTPPDVMRQASGQRERWNGRSIVLRRFLRAP